ALVTTPRRKASSGLAIRRGVARLGTCGLFAAWAHTAAAQSVAPGTAPSPSATTAPEPPAAATSTAPAFQPAPAAPPAAPAPSASVAGVRASWGTEPSQPGAPKPPPLHVEYVQYGAAIAAEMLLSSGAVCPSQQPTTGSPQAPCILGTGGGL